MDDKKKQLENSFKEWFGHYHNDRREQFEESYKSFLKTAGKEELVLFYEVYQGTYDDRYVGPDSWRTLYDYVWKLIPACRNEDASERQNAIIKELHNILVKNVQLVKKELLEENKKYLVLDLVLDILLAGWFKNAIGFPAVLYNVMLDEQNEDFAEFYGKEAQRHIAEYVLLKLSYTEKDLIYEGETVQGFQENFEIDLKKRIGVEKENRKKREEWIKRQQMGNQPTEKLQEDIRPKEMNSAAFPNEQIGCNEYNEKKRISSIIHEKKKYFIRVSAPILLVILVMLMAVNVSISNKYARKNEKLKEKVESLEREKEDLEEKLAENKKLVSQSTEEQKDKKEDNTSEEEEKSTTDVKNEDGSISVKAEESSSKEEEKASENNSKFPMEYTLQSNHNLREEPSASSLKCASIKEGTTVKVMREAGENWYEVELEDGKTGYLHIEALNE